MLFRGNVLASAIGTFFGNPWTFILIWLADYEIGVSVIHSLGYGADLKVLSMEELGVTMGHVLQFMSFSGAVTWSDLAVDFEQVFIPMLIGGIVLGLIAWFVSFFLTFWAVKGWRAHRTKRLQEAGKTPQRLN